MARVLLLDDSELILQMLEMVCQQAGHETFKATTIAEGRSIYSEKEPDIVVSDLNMPDCDDPVAEFQALGDVPIIVVSGRSQEELDAIAAERGADGAISKDSGMMGMASALPELFERLLGG